MTALDSSHIQVPSNDEDLFSEFIVYDDGESELHTPKHRCGVCQLNFSTKEACIDHIKNHHGSPMVVSDEAHKQLEDLVERLVNFDWCRCFTCLMLCKSLLDHVFQQHPVKSITLERQKQAQAKEQLQKDHSYPERCELQTNIDTVVPVASIRRRPSARTMIVNKKSMGDPRPEYQCYFCGDVSLIRSDMVKCVERHASNGWVDDDSIPLGNDNIGDHPQNFVGPSVTPKKPCGSLQIRKSVQNLTPSDARIHFVNSCKFCLDNDGEPLTFGSRRQSMEHRRDLHSYMPEKEIMLDDFNRFVVTPAGDVVIDGNFRYFLNNSFIERFECACLQKYQSRAAAQRCLARHIGEKPYKCTHKDCHFDFYTEPELRSHEKRIHLERAVHERVVCNECGASVPKQYLRLHWRKAHTLPVPCEVCQKMYKNSIRLRIHMRTVHEKAKHFRCRLCHKRFVHRSSADLCRAKHGQERVACNFCDRMFYTSAQRDSHRLTVHGKLEHG